MNPKDNGQSVNLHGNVSFGTGLQYQALGEQQIVFAGEAGRDIAVLTDKEGELELKPVEGQPLKAEDSKAAGAVGAVPVELVMAHACLEIEIT